MFKHTAYYTVTRIHFEFRKSRAKPVDDAPVYGTVYAQILIEGQEPSDIISTSIRCTRSDWDKRSKPHAPLSAKDLVKSMVKWEESIYSAAKTLFDQGDPITPETLVNEKNMAGSQLVTLERVYKEYLAFKTSRVGAKSAQERRKGQISPNTLKGYDKRWAYVSQYLREKGRPQMIAHKADGPFVQAYYDWLHITGLAPSTATKYAKLLTETLQWGIRQGLIKNLSFSGFKGDGEAISAPHNVTESEILRIEELALDSKMAAVRDGWLLARELCLHYSDYIALKPEHFTLNKDNKLVFEKARQKQEAGRNIRQLAFVSERALSIWKRYGFKIPCDCSNGNFSLYLKEIGYLAGLGEPLKFCHARDSGIFRWVALGVPDVQVRLAAGWRSARQMVRYINFDRRLLDELSAPKANDGGATSSTPITGTPFSKIDGDVNAEGGKGQRHG